MVVQTIRFRFRKRGDMRFLSHLDLSRAMEKAFRRACLPVAFTQGFNPHIRFSFPHALALGVESACEICEVCLTAEMNPADFIGMLRPVLPEDLQPYDAQPFAGCVRGRPLQTSYRFSGEVFQAITQESIQSILGRVEIPVKRSGKQKKNKPGRRSSRPVARVVDIRPAILDLQVCSPGHVLAVLDLRSKAGARIGEILSLLGIKQEESNVFIERTSLILETYDGEKITEKKAHEIQHNKTA